MPRLKIILFILLALLLLPLVLWPVLKGRQPAYLGKQAPAYQTIQRAINALEDVNPNPTTNELSDSVSRNAAALKIARAALDQPFELPEEAYNPAVMDSVIGKVGSLKSLALALKHEGSAAEATNALEAAARSYLDLIRYGQKIENGLLLFALVGVSFEKMGVEGLTGLEPKINVGLRAKIASELRALNAQRVPFATIEERERYSLRRNSPTPLHFLILRRSVRPAIDRGKAKYDQASTDLEALAGTFEGGAAPSAVKRSQVVAQ